MHCRHILQNGVRVITEYIPHVRSVSVGFWVEAGSIHETTENNGITHFIEHMLFKGTNNRNAKEIAEAIDNIGGQLNAFTGKECTCYYSKVLDTNLSIAIDVLSDMIFNSTFTPSEIQKEKGVIVEEINMYEDSPEDLVHDLLSKTIFDNSLGLPILGTQDTINSFDRDKLMEYMNNNYTTENIVIAVAGNFNTEEVINLLNEKLSNFNNKGSNNRKELYPEFTSKNAIRTKDTEQLHLCIGLEGVSSSSEEFYPLLLMNNIFGGSMSSRLFQNIREDKGLAYSVFSYPSTYKKQGLYTIYCAIASDQIEEVGKLIKNEVDIMKKFGLSQEELSKSKEQLKGNYILGLESTSSRMSSIGRSELLLNKVNSQKDIIEKIDKVTLNEINKVIQKIFNLEKASLALVGKIDSEYNLSNLLR